MAEINAVKSVRPPPPLLGFLRSARAAFNTVRCAPQDACVASVLRLSRAEGKVQRNAPSGAGGNADLRGVSAGPHARRSASVRAACEACEMACSLLCLLQVFKTYDHVKINATKSMIGHCLGAAAGLEAVACIKAIQTGKVHPSLGQT
eukprot:88537-Prorocentrum_minimum.AAC.2